MFTAVSTELFRQSHPPGLETIFRAKHSAVPEGG